MKISDDDRKENFLMALGQMAPAQGEPEINLKKMASMAAEAAVRGADILCFPELSYTGYFVRKERLLEIAETEDGVFVTWLRDAAKKYSIWIGAGYAERGGEGLYNTYLLANREGNIACRARKVHLWKSEKKRFVSGHEFPVIDTEFGKIAVLICYDMEFPETVRMAGLRGAETILCPAAWRTPENTGGKYFYRPRAFTISCSRRASIPPMSSAAAPPPWPAPTAVSWPKPGRRRRGF